MKKIIAILGIFFMTHPPLSAQNISPSAYAIPPMDAPILAKIGPWNIGTERHAITIADQVTISATGVQKADRTIMVRTWYPAQIEADAKRAEFTHNLPQPDGNGLEFSIPSIAVTGAAPVAGRKFPLVIVSHGYNGWDSFMAWLTENLATKGYVVVAIDHDDIRATHPSEFPISFGNVLINRAADQRAVIDHYIKRSKMVDDPIGQSIDTDNIGIVGYSMGGFGALATAGLDYDLGSPIFSTLPAAALQAMKESQDAGKRVAANIKAVVAMAPFGGRPDTRVWAAKTIAAFKTPTFIVDGDKDDIVGAETGVTWIFNQMSANKRHYLLFQNARHNIGGNPPPEEAGGDFSTWEYFAEPVWRTERINAINQHFITAFLDVNLKSDSEKSSYLDVPTVDSSDSNWPLSFGQNVGGKFAGDEEAGYWRGFRRRWSLGLEMHRGEPAE